MKVLCSTLAILLPLVCQLAFAALPELIEPENPFEINKPENAEPNNELRTEEDGNEEIEELGNELSNEWPPEENNPIVENAENVGNEMSGIPGNVEVKWDIDLPETTVKKSSMKSGKIGKNIVLPREFKNAIVIAHNRARMTTKPTASNMRKMSWDSSLEKLAMAYSRKCIYEHNPDATNRRFDYVGENLFISMGLPYNKKLLDHAVRAWDGEKSVFNYNTLKCKPGKMCGHYTQVVWADSFKVGCGVTRCENIDVRGRIWKKAILFACNYGPGGNYRDEKPFLSGRKCSKCDTGDQCKAKLCANTMRDRLFFNPKLAKWSKWSKWSACSKKCGMGSQRRERKCNTFVPTDCKGFGSEVKFCMNKPCASEKNGQFSYEVMLGEGDNFLPESLKTLLSQQNLQATFARKSNK